MRTTKKEKSIICIKIIEDFLINTKHEPIIDLAFDEIKENLNCYIRYLDKTRERKKRKDDKKRDEIKKLSEGTLCI